MMKNFVLRLQLETFIRCVAATWLNIKLSTPSCFDYKLHIEAVQMKGETSERCISIYSVFLFSFYKKQSTSRAGR